MPRDHAFPPIAKARKRLRAAMAAARNEEQLMQQAAQVVKSMTKWGACDVLVAGPKGSLILVGSTHSPEYAMRFRLGPGKGTSARAFRSGKPVVVRSGLQADPDYTKHPGIPEPLYDAAYVAPLIGTEGPLGVLFLRRLDAWEPTDGELKWLGEVVEVVAFCLEVFQHGHSAGLGDDKLGAVSEVTTSIASSPYLEEILQLLVNLTAQRFNYKVVTVRLLDAKRGELVLRATQATNKAYQRKEAIKLGESIAGRVIEENRTMIVPNVQKDADYIGHDLAVEQGLKSMICVPLTIHDRPLGVLTCYTGKVRNFGRDEIAALETLAQQAAISIEHARLQVRNTLMQEMHHRVKNNLQQIASLLRLQQRQSHYKSLEEALEDSLSRILAIAAVHELLSREDLDHVSIKSIAESLAQHQQQSFLLPGKRIEFRVEGQNVYLSTTQATQISLIINELLLNAVEHGFKGTDSGEVVVSVSVSGDRVRLVVSNTGDPLPPDFDPKKGQLGLQIIRSLSLGLGGEFSLETVDGRTVGTLVFKRATAE
jgi:two-component sensor histidine kinase